MWKLLRSKKLALLLIGLLAVEIATGRLNILFYSTVSIFWLNCLSCTLVQINNAWYNYNNLDRSLRGKERLRISIKQDEIKPIRQALNGVIQGTAFRTDYKRSDEQESLILSRNKWSIWGMAIFHVAILWTIFGAAWGGLNKLEGNTFVAEGLSVKEEHQDYANVLESPLFREKHAGFEVKLHEVELKYRGQTAPQIANVKLSIDDEGKEVLRDSLKPNQLLEYQGYKIKLNRRGFAPILMVDNGLEPRYHLLSLGVHSGVSGRENYSQKIFIVGLQQEIEFEFFPSQPDDEKHIVDYRLDKPLLQLTYVDEQGKKQVKTIGLNEPIVINGQKVSMVDAKSWVELIIFKTPGIYLVYFGFALGLLGLALYYGLPYQKITITISSEGNLTLYGYSKITSTNLNKWLDKLIGEVSKTASLEINNQQRKEEEIW